MKIISIINQKGGVSKTATAVHLGASLAQRGYRVLLIDSDPQTDLSKSFGVHNSDYNLFDLLTSEKKPKLRQPKPNLYLVPGYEDLEEIKISRFMLRDKLVHFQKLFDFCLIDCQPQKIVKAKLTINEMILSASNYLMIPLDANANTISGTNNFIKSIERIREKYNNNLKIIGLFFSIIDIREKLSEIYYDYVKKSNPTLLFKTFIRKDSKVRQATALGQTIFDYDKNCRASEDFENLATELLKRLEDEKK